MAFQGNERVLHSRGATQAQVDEGLRSYMLSVYNYMGLGLAMTGLVAFIVAMTPALYQPILFSPLKWVVMLAPLGLVFYMSARIHKMSASAAQMTFWAYAALNGLSLSIIFLAFTGADIARVFFITAATFGAMSLYGYTTKRDLSGLGSFLFMGLIGVVIASVVNIFIGSSFFQFIISLVGLGVFIGLTAYDTQSIKEEYVGGLEYQGGEMVTKGAVFGALRLYLDFINMFLMLLQLFQFMGGDD